MNLLAIAALCVSLAEPPTDTRPLELDEVLSSTETRHPSLAAARTGADRARGQVLSARGAFDPRVRVRGAVQPVGYYEWATVDTEVRARTLAAGLTPFAGWRLGRGTFPIYDVRSLTARAGEVRAGLELPLLRDSAIDGPRTARRKADNGIALADAEIEARRLELLRDAAISYWEWVAANARADIRARQLDLAKARDEGIRRQIADGNTAEVESLDNRRVIATRDVALVAARRDAQKAAFDLSLFLRDAAGAPSPPTDDRRPAELELPPRLAVDVDLDADIAAALRHRPEVAAAEQRRRNAELDARLARNQRLPVLGAQAYVAKDLGEAPPDLSPVELGVGVVFEVPIALRTARGDAQVARADLRRVAHEQRFLAERIAVEVKNAHVEMTAARRRAELAQTQADLAEQLAEAERARFALGDSTILFVNLREEAAADAAASHVDALADYRKARARYQVATGRPPRS